MNSDVICVGSSSVDVFVQTPFAAHLRRWKSGKVKDFQAYPVGSKILIDSLLFSTGGGGTNTAVALSRLGLKTAFLGKMGAGANAFAVSHELKREKVNSLAVCKKGGRTGYSIILDSVGHDRTILTAKGSNNDLQPDEIPWRKLRTSWFYFSSMLGRSFQAQKKIAQFAAKKKVPIAYNISDYLAKKGVHVLKPILQHTTIFILNREEALLLTGKRTPEEAFKLLNGLGIKYVVITDGQHGATAYHDHRSYHINADRIKVVETTGAGDAFAASFLAGMIKTKDIVFALKLAKENAESVIQHHGAKNLLLSWKEAVRMVERNKSKVAIRNIG
ncbi:carbohydrate kinase family protein [Candidatus Woesearchaeota archaeon]|nr:carbohydrate kinase family protein [Candidatus Woesearchaeota archaeon]